MYLADYHTHSRVSPDAAGSMVELARAAVAAGMDEVCFTDHVDPLVWGGTEPGPDYDWAALAQEFADAREAVGERLTLRLGIELGDAPWSFSRTKELLSAAPELDFIIGSIHRLSLTYGGKDLCYFDPGDQRTAIAAMEDYLERLAELAGWDGFDVLGHLTLPLRYFKERRGFDVSFAGYGAEIEDILRTVVQGGRGIELNVNRGGLPLPEGEFLRMYRRLGGERVTLGTDAHAPAQAGRFIREGQRLLQACGFTRFCTFSRRNPVWHEL